MISPQELEGSEQGQNSQQAKNEIYFFRERPLNWKNSLREILSDLRGFGGVVVEGTSTDVNMPLMHFMGLFDIEQSTTYLIVTGMNGESNKLQLVGRVHPRHKGAPFTVVSEAPKTEIYNDLAVNEVVMLITDDGRVFATPAKLQRSGGAPGLLETIVKAMAKK